MRANLVPTHPICFDSHALARANPPVAAAWLFAFFGLTRSRLLAL